MGGGEIIAIVAIVGVFSVAGLTWSMAIRPRCVRARCCTRSGWRRSRRGSRCLRSPGMPGRPGNPAASSPGRPAAGIPDPRARTGLFWLFVGIGFILSMRVVYPESTGWDGACSWWRSASPTSSAIGSRAARRMRMRMRRGRTRAAGRGRAAGSVGPGRRPRPALPRRRRDRVAGAGRSPQPPRLLSVPGVGAAFQRGGGRSSGGLLSALRSLRGYRGCRLSHLAIQDHAPPDRRPLPCARPADVALGLPGDPTFPEALPAGRTCRPRRRARPSATACGGDRGPRRAGPLDPAGVLRGRSARA